MSPDRKQSFGDKLLELSSQIAGLAIKKSLEDGAYIETPSLKFKFNKWGMEWPIGKLEPDLVDSYIKESQTIPLRNLVAHQIIQEAKDLWQKKKPEGYGTESELKRSIPDLAINEGYLKVGEAILYPDFDLITRKPVNEKSLRKDPTGLIWLNEKLETLSTVWNEIHKYKPEYNTPEDPAVMGMRQGIERYQEIYEELVKSGAKPDQKSSIFRLR